MCGDVDTNSVVVAPPPHVRAWPNASALHLCGPATQRCVAADNATCTAAAAKAAFNEAFAPLWGRAYALNVSNLRINQDSGFAVAAKFRQPWTRTSTSAISGLFSLLATSATTPVDTLQAWAYRSAAGVHAQLQVNDLTAQPVHLPACPPGIWTTLLLSVDPQLGILRAESACDRGVGRFAASTTFSNDAWPSGISFTASTRLWLGLYGVTPSFAQHVKSLPMRGDDLAGFAVFDAALQGTEVHAAMQDMQLASQQSQFSAMCAAGGGCAGCAACRADLEGTYSGAHSPHSTLLHFLLRLEAA